MTKMEVLLRVREVLKNPDERLHQKLKFCYFPISFCILCKTFELVARPFCILSWNPDVDLPFALNITKCASNEWC